MEYLGTIDGFQDVKEERDTYYGGVQADAKRIAAEHGLELLARDAPVIRAGVTYGVVLTTARRAARRRPVEPFRTCSLWG